MKKLFFVWLFVLLVLTSIPGNNLLQPVKAAESYLLHFFFYATLMLFLKAGYRVSFWKALIIIILIGAIDEAHQAFIPGRYPDVLDLLTDIAGGVFTLCMIP